MREHDDRPWLASYADGVPHDVDIPDTTLPGMLDGAVARFGPRTALDFLGAATSYDDLAGQVNRAARALHDLGVRRGDRVALVLPNCPAHVVAFYGALRLGAVVVEHNPLYTESELEALLADHGARVAVCWNAVAGTVQGLRGRIAVETVIGVDLGASLPRRSRLALRLPLPAARRARRALGRGRPRDVLAWEGLLAAAAPGPLAVPSPAAGDVALIQYTGGTTGAPRGAVLTHRNLVANAVQGRAWMPGLRDGEETVLAVLPLFHAFGLTLCLSFAISIGARLVLLPRFDPDSALAAVRRTRPTFLPGVPPIYDRMATAAAERGADLSSIRYGLSGAMALPPDLVRRWEGLTGGLLVEGYGMTEASPVALGNPASTARRPGTVGVPFPSTRIRVVDPEDPTQDIGDREPGELLVQGPQVFAGYWQRPDDTAAALLPGGWLRTGDVVTVDDDGFVRIVDRLKDLVITGGFNVYPSEVEAVLRRHADVADAAVVGFATADGHEEVTAALVAAPGATPDPERLREHCRRHLAGYKVPRRFVVVDGLPRSFLGKTVRRRLRDQLIEDGQVARAPGRTG